MIDEGGLTEPVDDPTVYETVENGREDACSDNDITSGSLQGPPSPQLSTVNIISSSAPYMPCALECKPWPSQRRLVCVRYIDGTLNQSFLAFLLYCTRTLFHLR